MTRTGHPHALNFSWLIKLRWGAIACQVLTILAVSRFISLKTALPSAALAAIIGVEIATNLAGEALRRSGRAIAEWHLVGIMALDVVLLSALLYLTGGPFNPFSFLYLVQIALAAVVLRARWTWLLVVLSLACSGFLFVDHRPLELAARTHEEHMKLHLRGMWVAFGVAATFIVYFLMRVTSALAARENALQEALRVATQRERLASLATLAAGAAHELATPLSTIATVARELERELTASGARAAVIDDVKLVRAQVDRCREILDQMAAHAGESAGEGMGPHPVADIVKEALVDLPSRPAIRVDLTAAGDQVRLPPRAVAQAVRVLLKNAQDASPDGAEIVLTASVAAGTLRMEVRDAGSGMADTVLARAGEPFFTTKAPGRGMGLGLFLTRTVAERLGGALTLESRVGGGTLATLTMPVAPATIGRIAPVEPHG